MQIPLTKPFFNQDEIAEVQSVLDSGWVSQGNECNKFEQAIGAICNTSHAYTVSNCTAALYLSLKALGIFSGIDEVIVADFSYPATGFAVMQTGAVPIFCDVDPYTYNIDPEKIESLINYKTRAIIPVHTFGNPCYMDKINKIASDHNISVIEDAACAFGSTYKGCPVGGWGDIGCFSFHARKGITTGEGGAIVTNNPVIYQKIVKYSTFGVGRTLGRKGIPTFDEMGFNFKMSDISAAIGVVQAKKLNDIIREKRNIARLYTDLIESKYMYTPQLETPTGTHIYQSYVVTAGKKRDKLIQHMKKNRVETTIGTYAQHIQPVFNSKEHCPVSHRLYDETISLPIYCGITEEQIHYVVDVMHKCH